MGWKVAATLEALRLLPGINVPPEYDGLDERLRSTTPGIALLGLFNRGKSTLFNALLGCPVSPVSWEAETSAFITASTGLEAAVGRRNSETIQLPPDPLAFSQAIARCASEGWESAEITGHFRLPSGVRLIDSPGLNEPGAHFGDDWLVNAIQGAIAVVSWPPGAAEQDLSLVEAASRALGGNVAVVVTQTTANADPADLRKVADKVVRESGARVAIAPASPPTDAWGASQEWAAVEGALDDLFDSASATQATLARSFEAWVTGVGKSIDRKDWTTGDIPALKAALAIDETSPAIRNALSGSISTATKREEESARRAARDRKAAERRAATKRAETKERDRKADAAVARSRVATAEAKAWRPAGFLDRVDSFLGGGATPLFVKAGGEFREVVAMARAGAPAAIKEVQSLLRQAPLLRQMELSPVDLMVALPTQSAQEASYRSVQLTLDEKKELYRRLPASPLKNRIEKQLAASLTSDPGMATQLKGSKDVAVRRQALESLGRPILAELQNLYVNPVEDLSQWTSWKSQAVWKAERWLHDARGIADSTSLARNVRDQVSYLKDHGHAWATDSQRHAEAAKRAHARDLSIWTGWWVASFVGWGISVLMLFAAGDAAGLSFIVWLSSFILWLVATSRRGSLRAPDAWKAFLWRTHA